MNETSKVIYKRTQKKLFIFETAKVSEGKFKTNLIKTLL